MKVQVFQVFPHTGGGGGGGGGGGKKKMDVSLADISV
jgi:hypothetical protein